MNAKKVFAIIFAIFLASAIILVVWWQLNVRAAEPASPSDFDGARAYADVEYQVALGPRTPGSLGHAAISEWLDAELQAAGWAVEHQQLAQNGQPVHNIIATRGNNLPDSAPWIIIGAHYDTRFYADHDPDLAKHQQPVPGANDGGSGVAVLLELARTLPQGLEKNVWLVFFDAEDNGRIGDWDWIMGSRAFVLNLDGQPDAAVIVDMVGDADLNLYLELNSDPGLSAEIWAQAAALGYEEQFIPFPRHRMIDDHLPFAQAGIPAVDIIDFDYPYWHTTADTLDKVSPQSLEAVGETLLAWLIYP